MFDIIKHLHYIFYIIEFYIFIGDDTVDRPNLKNENENKILLSPLNIGTTKLQKQARFACSVTRLIANSLLTWYHVPFLTNRSFAECSRLDSLSRTAVRGNDFAQFFIQSFLIRLDTYFCVLFCRRMAQNTPVHPVVDF